MQFQDRAQGLGEFTRSPADKNDFHYERYNLLLMSPPINKQRIFTLLFFTLIFVILRASAADSNERRYSLVIYGSGGVGNWDQRFNTSLSQLLGSEFG
jgi:hypothetical protein